MVPKGDWDGRLPVLIIGAGPTGLLASLLLSKRGISHRIIERRSGLHTAPQAHVLKTRSLEVFRKLALDAEIIARATPVADTRYINWFANLIDGPLTSLDLGHIRSGAQVTELSPTRAANLPQDELEELLFAEVVDRGGHVEFDTEAVSVSCDDGFATASILNLVTGERSTIEATFILAADGASSSIRRSLGIELIGPEAIAHFVAIYFESNLKLFMQDRPGLVNWGLDPETRGTLIVHGIERRAVFMHPYDPRRESLRDFPAERCEDVVRRIIGDPEHPFSLKSVGTWTMTAQVAERYRQGNVLLVGDAAHRFPPTGGLGLNTGVQDVFNLAWKIDLVLRRLAGDSLLDTYELECRPVADANCQQSLRNQLRNEAVYNALGLTGGVAHDRRIFQTLTTDTPEGADLRRRADAAASGQSPHYISFGLDLGFSYTSPAIISDGTEPIRHQTTTYVPHTRPGVRLPHCWLQRGSERVSTIDLAEDTSFTLFVGDDQSWSDAARTVSDALDVAISVISIGASGLADPSGRWLQLRGHDEGGALLVRPDGHVAWRVATSPHSKAQALGSALQHILAASDIANIGHQSSRAGVA